MDTFVTVKNNLESVRMALRWGKNTLRIKYVVNIAVSSVQQVTLEMHAEMRAFSRKMSFIGMTKLVVPNG